MYQEIARAKINLFLHVTGKRSDGYHLLDSLVVFTEYGDKLTYEASQTPFSLEVKGPFGATMEGQSSQSDNLVIKAARGLYEAVGRSNLPQGRFILEKNLPIASGIGGGSADAAATLRLLHRCWHVDIPHELMMDMAYKLGADVPVCYRSQVEQMQGIGEDLKPVKAFPRCGIVLVNCMKAISTPAIFKARKGHFVDEVDIGQGWGRYDEMISFMQKQGNSLQDAAISLCPSIQESLDIIGQQSGCSFWQMSGSGATCFGLFEDSQRAAQAAKAIKEAHPQWWTWGGALFNGDKQA